MSSLIPYGVVSVLKSVLLSKCAATKCNERVESSKRHFIQASAYTANCIWKERI